MLFLQILIVLNILYGIGAFIVTIHNTSINKKEFRKYKKSISLITEEHQKFLDSFHNVYIEEWHQRYSHEYYKHRGKDFYISRRNYKKLNKSIETFINWYRDKSPMFKGKQIKEDVI